MSSVDKIKWAMSLRDPQYEALQYFDAISSKIEYRTCSKADAEKIASENCQDPHTISVDKEFDFPSFCFDMTTGIGKSRLMVHAFIICTRQKGTNISLFWHQEIRFMTRCVERRSRDIQNTCLRDLKQRWEDQKFMMGKIIYHTR